MESEVEEGSGDDGSDIKSDFGGYVSEEEDELVSTKGGFALAPTETFIITPS
jgi:hypothetical protein